MTGAAVIGTLQTSGVISQISTPVRNPTEAGTFQGTYISTITNMD